MFTELYREEKREERDRGGQHDKGEIKRREPDPVSNQFPKCSPPSGTHKEIYSLAKRRGREEMEVTWWRKRKVQRGREQSSQ